MILLSLFQKVGDRTLQDLTEPVQKSRIDVLVVS